MSRTKNKQIRWSVSQAHEYAKSQGFDLSKPIISGWILKYKLGTQPGGNGTKLFVNPQKFKKFLSEKG